MSIREVKITNTLSGKKEILKTIEPGRLRLYSCGPTVYGLIHIGNLRAALVSDMLYRYFKRIGYQVNYVRNYTDIDDKIIKLAQEEGVSTEVITKRYIQEVEKDFAVAGIEAPTHKTLATEHIPEMIKMIKGLIQNGKAYVVDGEVLYSVHSFQGYGKLSKKNLDELQAGARVEVDPRKKDPMDFTLWKPSKSGEPSWESPWGKGRPGWHIECSAMARKWLGDQIDIHHGGIDLIFPHHENEIAQSEGCCEKEPFARYWVHHDFVMLRSEKMSKSLGNVFQAREFLTQFSGEIARYMLLSVHYRSKIDFNEETIENALSSLERLYEAKDQALKLLNIKGALGDRLADSAWGEFVTKLEQTRKEMDEHWSNDFNVSGVLASIFTLIREFNKVLAVPKAKTSPSGVMAAKLFIELLEEDLGSVLGIGRSLPEKIFSEIDRIRKNKAGTTISKEEIEKLIQERKDARSQKDFKRSDEIRDELLSKGVVLKDGPQGTTWSFK